MSLYYIALQHSIVCVCPCIVCNSCKTTFRNSACVPYFVTWMFPSISEIHISVRQTQTAWCSRLICRVLCSLCARLSSLSGAGPSGLNHQVITFLFGPYRQPIRLRGSMICSWKSTPLRSKSILSERLPKDKVPCDTEDVFVLSVCLFMWPSFSLVALFLFVRS